MARVRVHELATELDVDASSVLSRLKALGEYVKSPSSTIEEPVAERVRASFGFRTPPVSHRPSAVRRGHSGPYIDSPDFDPTAPSSRQHGWRSGEVPIPRHPDLLSSIEKLRRRIPEFGDHVDALRSLGSQVVHVRPCRQDGFKDCMIVHVRFSAAIENGFGFTREVMLFYSPHEDLQVRTFEAAARELAKKDQTVTPDIFFMWSPDLRLRIKMKDWSRPSKLAIPFLIDEEDELSLITLLRNHIYARDLFYMTTPVHGASFFGRRTILQSLRDDVFSQQVTGVFGLRKSGKTSILMQLKQELQDDQIVTVLMDLETFPSPPEDPTDDIVSDLRRRLIDELKAQKLRTQELSQLSDRPSILDFKNALQAILKQLWKQGTRVLLLLDEIEYLTPADRIDIAEGDMPRVAQLLSALRSVVQESENFTFVLSGLTSAIVEGGRLYGRPNPLFSWAKAVYVKPLARDEADELASTVGGKMGIQIEPGALEALHEASGGHAYLYRNLSSAVVQHLPTDVFQRTMIRSAVLTELDDWKSRVQGNIEEMIQHVKRYYATEAVLLEMLMDEPADFHELAPSEHVAVRRLRDLGLIVEHDGEYRVSVILELV